MNDRLLIEALASEATKEVEIARLRASNAELLAALKELAECSPCQNGCDPADMTCASNKARVAIANAEKVT